MHPDLSSSHASYKGTWHAGSTLSTELSKCSCTAASKFMLSQMWQHWQLALTVSPFAR